MNRIIDSQYFFVLGFQKSGTSTLYEWLKQIDNIKLPLYKETHYFSDLNFYNKGLDWYFKQFNYNDKHTHLGEIDPSYILCEEYLKRIHEFSSKETKFIFILRQPLERAYSHYLMSKFRGYESLSFKEAIKLEPDRLKNDENNFSFLNHSYLSRSNYPKHLNTFKRIFPSNKVLYLKMNDMFNKEKKIKMLNNILSFLDIKYDPCLVNLNIRANSASSPKSLLLQKLLYQDYFLKKIIKSILPNKFIFPLKSKLVRLNKKQIEYSNMNNSINGLINEKYISWNNKIVKETENITELSLSNWKY